MGGYRVRVETDDPLAIDEALCRKQRFQQQVALHGFLTLITVGLWSPVLIGWLAWATGGVKRFAEGYRVTVQSGMLVAGNAVQSRSIPLDAIADVAVNRGYVTISIRGASALSVYGLTDPAAAARAILEAREEHVRGVRAEVREQVFEAAVGETRTPGRTLG